LRHDRPSLAAGFRRWHGGSHRLRFAKPGGRLVGEPEFEPLVGSVEPSTSIGGREAVTISGPMPSLGSTRSDIPQRVLVGRMAVEKSALKPRTNRPGAARARRLHCKAEAKSALCFANSGLLAGSGSRARCKDRSLRSPATTARFEFGATSSAAGSSPACLAARPIVQFGKREPAFNLRTE
jgi:hypothetical protein